MRIGMRKKCRKVLSLLLAIALVFTGTIVFSPSKAKAAVGEYVDTVKINLEIPKCGQEVNYKEYDHPEYGHVDFIDYTPVAVSMEPEKYEVVPFNFEEWDSDWPIWTKVIPDYPYDDPNIFIGKITKEEGVYARFAVRTNGRYDFFTAEQWEEWDYYHYLGTVYVNGKKADAVLAYETLYIYAKVAPDHDWDEGKVTTQPTEDKAGVKTYTCKGCGATKTESIPATGSKGKDLLLAQMKSKGSKALNISWTKMKDADGYDVFFSKCNTDDSTFTPKLVKDIKGNATTKWTKKGLKKGKAYKAYVKAYTMKDGKKTYIAKSPKVHAYTANGNKKYTNAKSVAVKKSKASIQVGATFKIKASVKKAKSGKKLIGTNHTSKFRYFTDNEKVATVSSKGTVKGVKAGSCKIYVLTVNGIKKTVSVTVK